MPFEDRVCFRGDGGCRNWNICGHASVKHMCLSFSFLRGGSCLSRNYKRWLIHSIIFLLLLSMQPQLVAVPEGTSEISGWIFPGLLRLWFNSTFLLPAYLLFLLVRLFSLCSPTSTNGSLFCCLLSRNILVPHCVCVCVCPFVLKTQNATSWASHGPHSHHSSAP